MIISKISIIIPVYNVAPYLRECLDSVLAQTYTSWEAICVDDGSTDGSDTILDEYAAKDSRFRVIHQANAGVAAARNAALEIASGDWITFLDADDFFKCQTLEIINQNAKLDVDVVYLKYKEVFAVTELADDIRMAECTYIDLYTIGWDVYFHPIFATAYRYDKVKGLKFEALSIGEDRVWYLSAITTAQRCAFVDFIGYGYRKRSESAMRSPMTIRKFEDTLRHQARICEIVNTRHKRYSPIILRRLSLSFTEYASAVFKLLSCSERYQGHKYWIAIMKSVKRYNWISPYTRLVMRICMILELRFVTEFLCYGPYWLKAHGLHR